MGKESSQLILGALLHDIGKFIQRADVFDINHSKKGIDYLKKTNNVNLTCKNILDCVEYHHYSELKSANLNKNSIAYIVYEADNIASGAERRQNFEYEKEYKSEFESFDKKTVLKSVFNILNIDEKGKTEKGYPLRTQKETNDINYPLDLKTEDIKATKDKYQILKATLDKEIAYISNSNSLLQLLEALTTYIPSSTDLSETADISLYDHLKMTAALASCMYYYFKEKALDDYKEHCFSNAKQYRNEKYFKIVSADISGIQSFIYTIASKGALKSLRARSFYLDIILEHLADEILEELSLSRANILYTGGGHFYLILPNTTKTDEILKKFEEKVNDWFLKNFGIALYIAVASQECSSNDLMNPKDESGKRANLTGKIFKELSKKLSKKKLKRYSKEQLKEIFKINGNYNKSEENLPEVTRECSICHTSQKKLKIDSKYKDLGEICDYCLNLYKIGEALVKNEEMVFPIVDKNSENALALPVIGDAPRYLTFKKYIENEIHTAKRVYSKNQWLTGEQVSTNLWIGDYTCPSNNDNTIDFKTLAKSEDNRGVEKIAILRADVDNLGSIFVSGFNQKCDNKEITYENVTISRYATLSRQLSMFFKHYINQLCEGKKLVIIYSGGDDLFISGAWSDVVDFARELRTAFNKYTCGKLTFSAGIGFYSPSFPIYKMAELTGQLEDLAKDYPDKNHPTKNAVALFGIDGSIEKDNKSNEYSKFVFSWDELDEIIKIKEALEDLCYFDEPELDKDVKNRNKIFLSTALKYKLMSLIYESKDINIARLAYTLARLEPNENQKDKFSNYKKFKELIYGLYQDKQKRKYLLTAINLLVYENRDVKKEKQCQL